MTKLSFGSTIKSAVFTILGAALGLVLYFVFANPLFLIVACLGGFIGLAFSWPSTSIKNVARLTTGVIVSHNLPGAGEIVSEGLFGKDVPAPKVLLYHDLPKVEPITVTANAMKRLKEKFPNPTDVIRIIARENPHVPGFFLYNMGLDNSAEMLQFDRAFSVGELKFVTNQASLPILKGITLEYDGGPDDLFRFFHPS